MPDYEAIVGMEVHAELLTESKMFCRCANAFAGQPNTRCCPVCIGLPGALPVMNKKAVEHVVRAALALNCDISMISHWHRKNYFYPDLPKGYQISQYGLTPVGVNGHLDIEVDGEATCVRINRVHLEEDTGKLFHVEGGDESAVDYNRSGVPLMEIVTEFPPDIHTSDQAKAYLQKLRQVLVWVGATDGRMEEGSLRCEPNISVRLVGAEKYGTKSEIKNLNSFRHVQDGVEFEVKRHIALLEDGQRVVQATRGWNPDRGETFPMRTKESEQDYRYFPDPDLLPVQFTEEWLDQIRSTMPEMPELKMARYMSELDLPKEDATQLTQERILSEYFDACVAAGCDPKAAANWITGELSRLMNLAGIGIPDLKVTPAYLAELVGLLKSNAITSTAAKQVLEQCFNTGDAPKQLVKALGLGAISDTGEIEKMVDTTIEANPDVVEKILGGKIPPVKFLVGQVMKAARGRANAADVETMILKKLGVG